MKQFTLFIAMVLALITLSGCESAKSADTENTAVQSTALHGNIISNAYTQPENNIDQTGSAKDVVGAEETVIHIGDMIQSVTDNYQSKIILKLNGCIAWKDASGYRIAFNYQSGIIYSVVHFSDSFEYVDAEGIDPVDEINKEEWIGKKRELFFTCYGSGHFDFGDGLFPSYISIPSYISKMGIIYYLHFHEGTDGPITDISSLALKDLSFTDPPDAEVHIGGSIYPIRNKVEGRILFEQYSCTIWKDTAGYTVAITAEDSKTICSLFEFSEDLKLLEAAGTEPIHEIAPADLGKWVGKTEEDFIAQYGYCHCDFGSMYYYPSYFSETGIVYTLHLEHDIIKSISGTSLIDLNTRGREHTGNTRGRSFRAIRFGLSSSIR